MPRAKSTSAAPESKGKPYSKPSSSSKGKSPAPAAGAKKKSKNPTNKKQGAWSSDELKALYDVMCPKRTGVKWDEVARAIPGRDAKSCNNKPKIMEMIMALAED
ncbi:hypothetical protein A1Q2_04167 [Trichosporon asahii var. asahii CBS 8904]|uniref:Myb-like domain-containing protein n=2 Tax=Trichosporon asahii var. asahii TaxID=189963 RepID=K1VLL1_TRIAC|nr:hypothetical protein A1Q1_03335 [Trichosporon asahii var. asahii CBS 2479]EJT47760.1 hypothetical protein A1Q1_03335 [Trichosporon asahii var. asahii CBS 2479]EKD01606.1 hypothetical protein A1Q2_04167 [Trichosporon asahii var. asahii CBS 8904]